ncbi:hypothetical protein BJ742DRAFT_795451 [Cladochytrium replicatum]|nr:hypothetical protein BJ742DRAFT_795451 [Cladochytrium replicatum]
MFKVFFSVPHVADCHLPVVFHFMELSEYPKYSQPMVYIDDDVELNKALLEVFTELQGIELMAKNVSQAVKLYGERLEQLGASINKRKASFQLEEKRSQRRLDDENEEDVQDVEEDEDEMEVDGLVFDDLNQEFSDDADETEEEEYMDEDEENDLGLGGDIIFDEPSNVEPFVRQILLAHIKELQYAGFRYTGFRESAGENAFTLFTAVPMSEIVSGGLLSEDQCEAWDLEIDNYIVILMKFNSTYVPSAADEYRAGLFSKPQFAIMTSRENEFRGNEISSAIAADAKTIEKSDLESGLSTWSRPSTGGTLSEDKFGKRLCPFPLSRTIKDAMNARFLILLSLRLNHHTEWAGAEVLGESGASIGVGATQADELERVRHPAIAGNKLNDLNDLDEVWPKEINLPLLLVRYTLRRLALAHTFCMVCHRPLTAEIEFVKPFVCDAPLCTFQYLQLGLGPNVDFEILHNPAVVELLINLAFTAANSNALNPFPRGVGVNTQKTFELHGTQPGQICIDRITDGKIFFLPNVRLNQYDVTNPIHGGLSSPTVGDRVEITWKGRTSVHRIDEVTISTHSISCKGLPHDHGNPIPGNDVRTTFYRRTFVGWDPNAPSVGQSTTTNQFSNTVMVVWTTPEIELVAETLKLMPSVQSMQKVAIRQYPQILPKRIMDPPQPPPPEPEIPEADKAKHKSEATIQLEALRAEREAKEAYIEKLVATSLSVKDLCDTVDPLCYPLLRWIVGSNRSFLRELSDPDEKLTELGENYMQFKMVMGSPEKESLFGLEREKFRHNDNGKPLWAWHGSPLKNWHSIIRTGLNFNTVSHGRAYGNGIYHAKDMQTSVGYTGNYHSAISQTGRSNRIHNCLHVLSLNEIVNNPKGFASTSPYLVIPDVNWVQTRYLIVQVTAAEKHNTSIVNLSAVASTTNRQANSLSSPTSTDSIASPSAGTTQTEQTTEAVDPVTPQQRRRPSVTYRLQHTDAKALNGKSVSVPITVSTAIRRARVVIGEAKPVLDDGFDDGTEELIRDHRPASTMALVQEPEVEISMPPPEYSSVTASKALQKELKALAKSTMQTPLDKRFWDFKMENVVNLYQWSINLINFDPNLPLSKDMEAKNIYEAGVKMEIRFAPDFPMTPPYIRVVRPRFLQFINGGGGHVTAGGSICIDTLTSSGWLATYSIESLLLQVYMALSSLDPRPARLDPQRWNVDYGAQEGMDAFIRVAQAHGWAVPNNWRGLFAK